MSFDKTTYLEDLDINSCKMHYIVKKRYNEEPLYESFFRKKIEKFLDLYNKLSHLKKRGNLQSIFFDSKIKNNLIPFFVFWSLMLLSIGMAIFTYGDSLAIFSVILSTSVFFLYLKFPNKYTWEITFLFKNGKKADVKISSFKQFEYLIQELEKR